ncbi:MAG: VanZ family protein [Lachnospiraceae bacterium]|nr:VanZ family protein [Lachnospiraceae bacterium]
MTDTYIFTTIISDLSAAVINYGAGAAMVGAAAVPGLLRICRDKAEKKFHISGRFLWLMALTLYAYFALTLTLFNRNFGQFDNSEATLTFFQMSVLFPELTLIHLAENFMLTLPLGFLLPQGFKIFRKPYFGAVSGLVMSIIIETTQYFTGLGHFELDDIIMNTLGAAAGYLFFIYVSKRIGNGKRQKI